MNIAVIVPTYRRPKDLARCLEALKNQTRPADEVIVTVRDTDAETWDFLKEYNHESLPLHTVTVKVPGVVAAMNAGLDVAQGDIIAFTDDDAAPHPDWLEKIEAHFLADELIGGVGGRDVLYQNGQLVQGEKKVVGKLQWFGRAIGNHHLGTGEAREVDILKGVNMSFRRAAIQELRFDKRMKGTGAQVHFELAFCLALKRAGWKLIYDPKILVDHHWAQRFDEDRRGNFSDIAMVNRVHNETLILLENLSTLRRTVFLLWAILVGTRANRGFLQCLRFLPDEGFLAGKKLQASLQGIWRGWQTWRQTRVENMQVDGIKA
ncbi:MAG: glycosyltransferase family 2 protein [Pleurocapsa sp. MO_192.B19]|nr:glycosyltransferase family 2 protein [Pleurocapsa sp. MO_192.B19]